MSKKLDQILVIDLEATCWEGKAPEGMRSEIIEIGICPLELHTGRRLEKRSILVRPIASTDTLISSSSPKRTAER